MNSPSRARFVHQVDVQLADTRHTDDRASLDRPTLWTATGVDCLVCDHGGGRMMGGDRSLEVKHVRVLFPDPVDLRIGHQLAYTTPEGRSRIFLVESSRDDQDLGRLWVAECTEHVDIQP